MKKNIEILLLSSLSMLLASCSVFPESKKQKEKILEVAYEQLAAIFPASIDQNIALPSGIKDSPVTIEYTTNNLNVLNNDGTINRQEDDTNVVLTIKLSYKDVVISKDINIVVLGTGKKIDPIINPSEFNVSDYYGGYYTSLVSWTNSEDLKNKLYDIISKGTYQPIKYEGNWETCQYADQDLYDHEYLDVLYSDIDVLKTNTTSQWQREHCFCASLMCDKVTSVATSTKGRATDFHNIFASNSSCNSSRSNKNLGNVNSGNKIGNCEYNETTFEPADEDKGTVARSLFYMAVMYKDTDETYQGLTLKEGNVTYSVGNCEYAHGNLSDLLEWNKNSVSYLEYQHNESVYSHVYKDNAQGNRNPFVDYPELVDYCFGSKMNESGELKYITPSFYSLNMHKDEIHHYAIKKAKRTYKPGESFSLSDVEIVAVKNDLSEIAADSSLIRVENIDSLSNLSKNTKVVINTPTNYLEYDIAVSSNPIEDSLYKHTVTAKSTGQDFNGIDSKSDQENKLTLSNVEWSVYWKQGKVSSNSAIFGTKFGTSTAAVNTLRFTTVNDFEYEGKSNITSIHYQGGVASGSSCTIKFYINDEEVYSSNIAYIDQNTTNLVSYYLPTPKQGKVKIEITNITSAVYVKNIAIDAN